MDKQKTFSLRRIIFTDHFSCAALVLPLFFLGVYLLAIYYGYVPTWKGLTPIDDSQVSQILYLVIFTALIGGSFLSWRIRFFRRLYVQGVEVTGNISLEYIISRKRVEYKYTYQGVDYWRGNALTDRKYRNYFYEGQEVTLLVDPQNPKRAVIRDLYF